MPSPLATPHPPPARVSSREWIAPVVLAVIAVIVSAAGSWIPSIWFDEAATISGSTRTLPQLWKMMHSIDAVHGAYYASMHVWTGLFGTSPFALRLPSALAIGVATAGVWFLARGFGTRTFAVAAACCFIVLPRVTWMGVEGRSWALATALAVWSMVVLLRLARRNATWVLWLAYALLNGVGVAVNLYLVLLAPVQLIALVAHRRARTWRTLLWWGGAWAVSLLMAFPVLRLAVHQSGQLPFGSGMWNALANQLLLTQYFSGALPTVARTAPWPPGPEPWSWALVILSVVGWVLAIIGVVVLVRDRRPGSRVLLVLAVAWVVVPLGIVVLFSLVRTPIYAPRYFGFTAPAMALLFAVVLRALPRPASIAVFALIVVLAAPLYVAQRVPTAKNGADTGESAQFVEEHREPGDVLYVGEGAGFVTAAYPGTFDGMPHPGRLATGADAGRLFDRNEKIDAAFTVPSEIDALWLVESAGNAKKAEVAAAQEERMRQLGFESVLRRDGTLDAVSRWVRVEP